MLKYGLKLWSKNKPWFREAVDLCKKGTVDFIELYIVPNSFSLKELEILKAVPVSLHAPHWEHDFNIFELNEAKIKLFQEQVVGTANFLNSKYIIVHAGIGESKEIFKTKITPLMKCSIPGIEHRRLSKGRLLIENMTKIGLESIAGRLCFGYSLEQLKFIKEECGFEICLDFSHAARAALSQKLDYKNFIQSLILELNPSYFHICGTKFNTKEDEHQDLFDSDLDIVWAKKILLDLARAQDIYLVFEVPKPKKQGLKNDINNINYFKGLKPGFNHFKSTQRRLFSSLFSL